MERLGNKGDLTTGELTVKIAQGLYLACQIAAMFTSQASMQIGILMNNSRFQKFNKKLGIVFIVLSLLSFRPGSLRMAQAGTSGFNVSGRYLLDANGNNFMMRGINARHNW